MFLSLSFYIYLLEICIPNQNSQLWNADIYDPLSVILWYKCHSTIRSNPCWLCHVIMLKEWFVTAENNKRLIIFDPFTEKTPSHVSLPPFSWKTELKSTWNPTIFWPSKVCTCNHYNLPLPLDFLVYYSLPQVYESSGTCIFYSLGRIAYICFWLVLAFYDHLCNSPSFEVHIQSQWAWATYTLYLGIYFSSHT